MYIYIFSKEVITKIRDTKIKFSRIKVDNTTHLPIKPTRGGIPEKVRAIKSTDKLLLKFNLENLVCLSMLNL